MTAQPAISLGIPVYNGVSGIRPLIESLLGGRFSDVQLIVNDNGSTDGTTDVLRELERSDSRLSIGYFPENRGVQANFNEVLSKAEGALFKWCAVNDVILPGYLESIVPFMANHPEVTLGHCRYDFTDGDHRFSRGSNAKRVFDQKIVARTTHRIPAVRVDGSLRHYGYGGHFFGVHRTELLHRVGAHAEYAGTDRVITAELAAFGPFYWDDSLLWSCFCPNVDPVNYVDYGLQDGDRYPDLDAKLMSRATYLSLDRSTSAPISAVLHARQWERRLRTMAANPGKWRRVAGLPGH